ncbi:MAG TPA: 16S rRNA (guanine(527)-N(7))-methyltransferase RsmG [Bryobacteraceae bacterium]|nr:16S rRNA (guanine(527)-N(7))-methyltransferase RsmG [Bryobacteraceae bacterium]
MAVPAWFTEVLERELRAWLSLSADQVSKLYTHYQFLERWNQKISLTSLEPGVELVVRHYCESLFLGAHLPAEHSAKIVDVGSGAGFPGVPIAVLHPKCAVTLVESVQRKAVFLRESTRHLGNVTVLAQRAEEIEGGFDWVVARAVNPREILSNLPRLAPRVSLLVGEKSFSELKNTPGIAWAEPLRLPWGDRRYCVLGSFHVEQ